MGTLKKLIRIREMYIVHIMYNDLSCSIALSCWWTQEMELISLLKLILYRLIYSSGFHFVQYCSTTFGELVLGFYVVIAPANFNGNCCLSAWWSCVTVKLNWTGSAVIGRMAVAGALPRYYCPFKFFCVVLLYFVNGKANKIKKIKIGRFGGEWLFASAKSITFLVTPLHCPTSGHKFTVNITEASLARNKVETNPHVSSEGLVFATVEEWRFLIWAIGWWSSNCWS